MCFFLLFTSEFERKLTKKIIGGLNKANDVSQHLSPNTHTKGKWIKQHKKPKNNNADIFQNNKNGERQENPFYFFL